MAYVFPVPFVMGRHLEQLVFTLVWGGRNEQVACVRMYMEWEKGGKRCDLRSTQEIGHVRVLHGKIYQRVRGTNIGSICNILAVSPCEQ